MSLLSNLYNKNLTKLNNKVNMDLRFLNSTETNIDASNKSFINFNNSIFNQTDNESSFNQYLQSMQSVLNSIPLWVIITVSSYFVFATVAATVLYRRMRKYYTKTELNSTSCCCGFSEYSDCKKKYVNKKRQNKGNNINLIDNEENNNNDNENANNNINNNENNNNNANNLNDHMSYNSDVLRFENHDDDDEIDINYPELKRYDVEYLSFIRFWIASIFLWWLRLLIMFICLLLLIIASYLITCCNFNTDPLKKISKSRRFWSYLIVSLCMYPMFYVLGFITCFKKKKGDKVREVYKKYLGEDYDIDIDRHYSCYISNHYGWVETFFWGTSLLPGFIAKKELGSHPILGPIMATNNCLLLDRSDNNNKKEIAGLIAKRQAQFYEKETQVPLLIYPEGSTTNGKYIFQFKRGAFMSKLPIKPLFAAVDQKGFGLSDCPMNPLDHFFYTYSFLWRVVYFYELPVVSCTEYMINTHALENEKDYDTYARVCNLIYQEIFDLKYSNKDFKDVVKYEKLCAKR